MADTPTATTAPSDLKLPPDLKDRLARGRREMLKDANKRRLCVRFERGDTYFYEAQGKLYQQDTVTNPNGSGKPPHRIRNKYNFIRPIVEAKVSAATQRVPSYEITPTSTDQARMEAASLSEKLARYGYDQWRIRSLSLKVVKLAIAGGGEGFALPYFDDNVGPYRRMADGSLIGEGEIKTLHLSRNQVYWEAGVDFEDSPWWAIERARPVDEVYRLPGYSGPAKLTPDASTSDIPNDRGATDNLVMVTEYFERPCKKYPAGRCITLVAGSPIVDYRVTDTTAEYWWGPYPLVNDQDEPIDEPILHRLVYTVDPDDDSDLGLVWQLIDFQRTIQDAYNKLLEWKNRCLNPQMKAVVGSIITPPDDVPGAIRYYKPIGGKEPEWERGMEVPQSLFRIIEQAKADMREVAADQNIDPAPNLAARTLDTAIEQSMNRWQSFLGDLAEFHSRFMRHCLVLAQRHYSEPRKLQIRGRDGWELIPDFQGAQLMGQVDVRVLPQSLAPVTRAGVQDQLTWINTNWPGWLNPEAALMALQSGSLDRLTQSTYLDIGRANTVIQKIIDGTVMGMPTRSDTMPDGTTQEDVPGFMPSPVDNLNVWKTVFGDFLKTDSYQRLDPAMQEVANQIWAGIQFLEQQRAIQQAQQQSMMAAQLGMQNAAAPQAKGMPSTPGSNGTPPPVEVTRAAT